MSTETIMVIIAGVVIIGGVAWDSYRTQSWRWWE